MIGGELSVFSEFVSYLHNRSLRRSSSIVMRKLNQFFGDKKSCSSYWLGWMFATARKIMVSVIYLFIYLSRFNSLEKSSCFTTQPFLDLVHDRWAAGQTSYKLREYKINRELLSGRRSSLITANILSEVSNRSTFQISRPSLGTLMRKFTLLPWMLTSQILWSLWTCLPQLGIVFFFFFKWKQ